MAKSPNRQKTPALLRKSTPLPPSEAKAVTKRLQALGQPPAKKGKK